VCRIDGYSIGQEGDIGERLVADQFAAQDVHRRPNLLEAHPGVKQTFHYPQLDDVAE